MRLRVRVINVNVRLPGVDADDRTASSSQLEDFGSELFTQYNVVVKLAVSGRQHQVWFRGMGVRPEPQVIDRETGMIEEPDS